MKTIQVRNVPDDLHRALMARAAREGLSLAQLIMRDLSRIAYTPSVEEVFERVKSRGSVPGGPSSAHLVREDRDRR